MTTEADTIMLQQQLLEAQQEIQRLQEHPTVSMLPVVYIAHRLNAGSEAEIEANRQRASRWVAWAARQGVAPVATWIVLSGQWSETPENRALGIACDLATIERCHEFWMVGEVGDDERSTGMRAERDHARRHHKRVRLIFTHDGEPPTGLCGDLDISQRMALPADGGTGG